MNAATAIKPEDLLTLIGRAADDPLVQTSLDQHAHGMRPELDPDDEEALFDWVTVNEFGLEYGFEDEAYLRAAPIEERRGGALVLAQIYFYGDTPKTQPYPYALPFGLEFKDDRAAVRQKLVQHEATRRSCTRDFWALPDFCVAVSYAPRSGTVESVLCYLQESPWPASPEADALAALWPPTEFLKLFGRRWSSTELRTRFSPFGYEDELKVVRSEGAANFHRSHGLELHFAPGGDLRSGDPKHPRSLALAGVTFFSSRELDARRWAGELPRGLSFDDTPNEVLHKLGVRPASEDEGALSGTLVWHLEHFTLVVTYSAVECRVLRVAMMDSGLFADDDDDDDTEPDPPDDDE